MARRGRPAVRPVRRHLQPGLEPRPGGRIQGRPGRPSGPVRKARPVRIAEFRLVRGLRTQAAVMKRRRRLKIVFDKKMKNGYNNVLQRGVEQPGSSSGS